MPMDLIWAAIREIGNEGAFSLAEIMVLSTASRAGGADTTPLLEATVAAYCAALEKGGFIAATTSPHPLAARHRCLRCYQLIRDVGVEAPHVGADGKPTADNAARTQLWRAMRMHKGEFTRADLAAVCPDATDEQAKFLCAQLERAGYLRASGKKRHVFNRYTMMRDSGPRPPIIGRDLSMIDGNTGEVMVVARRGKS